MNTLKKAALAVVLVASIGCADEVDTEEGQAVLSQQTTLPLYPAILTNLATGFVLDSNAAGQAYTHVRNTGPYQRWSFVGGGVAGTIRLVNKATGLCLDSNVNGKAYTLQCNGGNYQQWYMGRNGDDTVSFVNLSTGLCLDSNANQQLYTHVCNGGSYQRWKTFIPAN